VSAARRARAAGIAAHKAAGTFVPRAITSHYTSPDVVRLVARESGIKLDRMSLLESSEYSDVLTAVRAPSAESHQLAPPNEASPGRNVSSAALYAD
jgi:hypothetical protein